MIKIFSLLYSLLLFFISFNSAYAEDLRDFKVGSSIEEVPERGYVNLRSENEKEILKWRNFKNSKKTSNNYYISSFGEGFSYWLCA